MKILLVILLASVALQVSGGIGLAAPAFPQTGTSTLPLLCSYNVSQHYCDLRMVLLIDDTGSMRSNDPALMRDQAAKNLVDILYQEYYQPALDAQAADSGIILPDIQVAVIHFSHCVSKDPSDNCGNDAKFNSGWLPITQRENLYSAIDWLKTQPNFYRLKQYTHFAEPFQAATDLFNQPAARTENDCVHRAILLLTDGTPEEAAGPLNEPELGNEMGQVKNIVKAYLSEPGNSIFVTAFKIVPRYWLAAEPYWKDIAGSSNVSLENSLDGVASRMEKIAAAEIGARSSTLSPDPKDARLYTLQLLHHLASLRITYYKLNPNATLTLTGPAGEPVIPDGTTVTQTGKGTGIEVWTLNDPAAGTYQIKTSAGGGIITTIPLYALSLQLDAPSPAEPLLQFTDGVIRFKLLDSINAPVLPTDDPPFNLNVQASLKNPAGGSTPLTLTQNGEDYRAAWMPLTTEKVALHVSAELTDTSRNSLWKCEGDGGDLPIDPVGVRVDLPSACAPVNTTVTIPLQWINARTGQNTAIDPSVSWQISSVTTPSGKPVISSANEVDAKSGAYRLTITPVLHEDVRSHITAGMVVNGRLTSFYDDSFTISVCPPLPPPPPFSCAVCNGYWSYLLWLLAVVLIALSLSKMMFRKKDEKYSRPFWLLIILLILLILIWLLWCCRFLFWPLLILLLILLAILLLLRLIGRDDKWKSASRFWLSLILLVLLMLIWLILFSGYWVYLFLMLLALLAILMWVWFRFRNRNEQEPFPSWLLLILLIVLVSIWLIFFGKFTLWLALILLLVWLVVLLLAGLFSQEDKWRSSYRFWSLILLLLVLVLVWFIYFSGYRIYLFWLLILLLLLWLATWLLYQYSNPLWGVIGIADRRNRILWSARLAGPDGSGGKSYYVWNFKDPIRTVKRIRVRSFDQREGWLVLSVITTAGRRTFKRTLNKWRDCDLGAGCRIIWREEARPPKRAEPRQPKSGEGRRPRPTRYDVEEIEGVGRVYAARLKRLGIHTTDELLKAAGSRKGRKELAEEISLSVGRILEWVNRADLMRVPGVGEEYSDLLEAGGVDTVKELRQRNPENLWDALRRVNEKKRLVRRVPTLEEARAWVAAAKKMKAMVKY
jgi:predicted flap endonuclease-1-like 5' DNA nuclease